MRKWVKWCLGREIFTLNLRSLAFFRICLALLLLVELKVRAKDLRAHYTDEGVLPRYAMPFIPKTVAGLPSLHRLTGTERGQQMLFALHAAAATSLLIGFHTRTSTFLSWLMLISLQNRMPLVLQGDDGVRRTLLYWGMFLPLGAKYSLDRKLAPVQKQMPEQVRSMGTVALTLQVCMIYWFTALLKRHPIWLKEGTAIYYALRMEHIVRPFGRWLLTHPRLLKLLSLGTVPFEFFTPFLLFSPVAAAQARLVAVLSFALFHLGLGRSLVLGLFAESCIVAWLPFLPGQIWETLEAPKAKDTASLLDEKSGKTAPHNDLPLVGQLLALVSLALVLLWNLKSLQQDDTLEPIIKRIRPLVMLLRLDQRWAMFAPFPQRHDGWYVIRGVLKNGSEVDLMRGQSPVTWEKPKNLSTSYGSVRWRQFMHGLAQTPSGNVRIYFAHYLRREWNRSHPPEEQLQSLKIYYMYEETLLDFQRAEPFCLLLWDHDHLQPAQPTSIGCNLPPDLLRPLAETERPSPSTTP